MYLYNFYRYMKDSNQKTNIKPPDLWIHHDQMELKALEKSSLNGEPSTSGVTSNTLPRSSNLEYNQDNVHGNSSSLDKRTYVPSYMGKYIKFRWRIYCCTATNQTSPETFESHHKTNSYLICISKNNSFIALYGILFR